VRHAPWLEDQVTGTGDTDLVADLDADLAFEDVGVFILEFVRMQRSGEDAGSDRVLYEGETASALIPPRS
jgi:hypothetical protein